MTPQECFDTIILSIESKIANRKSEYWEEPVNPKDVSDYAFLQAECSYLSDRNKNEIFKFLTGMTLPQYINHRIMMYLYKFILDSEEYDVSKMINILGVSNEPSLYKKFKETFSITPKEAYVQKDKSLYEDIKLWEQLTSEDKEELQYSLLITKEKRKTVTKINKKAYGRLICIITIIVALVGIAISLLQYYNKWGGNYRAYYYRGEMGNNDFWMANVFDMNVNINPFKMKMQVSALYTDNIFSVSNLCSDSFIITHESGTKYNCNRAENGFIWINYDNGGILLIPDRVYKTYMKIWDGEYMIQAQAIEESSFWVSMPDSNVFVLIDIGTIGFKYKSSTDEISYYGNISYIDDEKIEFYLKPSENEAEENIWRYKEKQVFERRDGESFEWVTSEKFWGVLRMRATKVGDSSKEYERFNENMRNQYEQSH